MRNNNNLFTILPREMFILICLSLTAEEMANLAKTSRTCFNQVATALALNGQLKQRVRRFRARLNELNQQLPTVENDYHEAKKEWQSFVNNFILSAGLALGASAWHEITTIPAIHDFLHHWQWPESYAQFAKEHNYDQMHQKIDQFYDAHPDQDRKVYCQFGGVSSTRELKHSQLNQEAYFSYDYLWVGKMCLIVIKALLSHAIPGLSFCIAASKISCQAMQAPGKRQQYLCAVNAYNSFKRELVAGHAARIVYDSMMPGDTATLNP